MTHVGPWVLGAAIALLAAGVVSTGSGAWKDATEEHQVIELDMQGIDSLDTGNRELRRVEIARQPAQVRIKWFKWAQSRDKGAVSASREGGLLRITGAERPVGAEIVVVVPPGLSVIAGRGLKITAMDNAGKLALEAWNLEWDGDAEALDIRVQARARSIDGGHCANVPAVVFQRGQVGLVRISIEAGRVRLGDLTGVKRVELHAGPTVGVAVDRVGDLQRIEMHPFDREPTLPPEEISGGLACMEYPYRQGR